MRLFINDIEVDNYAFITEIYEDRIILDKEITIPPFKDTTYVASFPRVYGNLSSISITGINGNVVYLDNERNWHCNRSSRNGPFGLYITHGALIVPLAVPEAVRRVLYSLFGQNKLRVAKTRYAKWQDSVIFPSNRDFELAWRIENRLGTHNPDYIENSELSLDTCDFCIERYYKGSFSCHCDYYCGKDRERLRERILKTSMQTDFGLNKPEREVYNF